jgi:hypothetical protein
MYFYDHNPILQTNQTRLRPKSSVLVNCQMKKGLMPHSGSLQAGCNTVEQHIKSKSAKKLIQKKKSIEVSFDFTVSPGKKSKLSYGTHAQNS